MPMLVRIRFSSFLRNSSTFLPSMHISPLLASIMRLIHRSSVDFPAPEGPMIDTNSPLLTEKLTSVNARVSDPYCLDTCLNSNNAVIVHLQAVWYGVHMRAAGYLDSSRIGSNQASSTGRNRSFPLFCLNSPLS